MSPSTETFITGAEVHFNDLLTKLWCERKLITICTGIGLAISSIYAYTAPQVWTSTATIAPPSIEQMGTYFLLKKQLEDAPLFSKGESKVSVNVQNISSLSFPSTSTSAEAAQAMQLFEDAQLLLDTTPHLKLLRPDGRKQKIFQVQTSAQTASAAQLQLTLALNKVNQQLAIQRTQELNSQRDLLRASLQAEHEHITLQSRAKRTAEVTQTRLALDTAKRAGIENFSGSSYTGLETSKMRFLLGSRLLQAQLDTLNKSPLDYPERYFEIEALLKVMDKLPKIETENFSGFRVIAAPSAPSRHDKLTRSMIIGLGMTSGLLFGILWILGKDTLPRLRDKLNH